MAEDLDTLIRARMFQWLAEQVSVHGDVLPRSLLKQGIVVGDLQVPLVSPRGIHKPQQLAAALTITSAPSRPYDDSFDSDGFLLYRYEGSDPGKWTNRALRSAMQHQLPLAYFHGVAPDRYLAFWPAYVVGDDPNRLVFTVDIGPGATPGALDTSARHVAEDDFLARRYAQQAVRRRIHQQQFRQRVLRAYSERCAFCGLRHPELLDAAHLIPDTEPLGEPIVPNGLLLCTLHHSAFDRQIIGLRPDYVIEVREDVRREQDGPTLVHAIQALHERRIYLPRRTHDRPDRERVEIRYERFRKIAGELAS